MNYKLTLKIKKTGANTLYKKLGFSRLLKVFSRIKLLCRLIVNRPVIPNFSYSHRYAQAEKRQRHSKMTMKLDMKNETDRQITRHSLPTKKYFNFFTHRTKILKFYCHRTLHTFASRSNQPSCQNLQKSVISFPSIIVIIIILFY